MRDTTEREQTREALRESEYRLRIVPDHARVGLVVIDREHRYEFANAAYCDLMKFPSPAHIIGHRIADVLPSIFEEQI